MPACPTCDAPVEQPTVGRRRVYCSTFCQERRPKPRKPPPQARPCISCGEMFTPLPHLSHKQRRCSQDCGKPEPKSCPYCGMAMENIRRVQCGESECKRRYNAERMRMLQLKCKAETGKWLTDKYGRKRERTCVQCGKHWESGNAKAKYCSNACQAAYEHGPGRSPKLSRHQRRRIKAQRRLDRAAIGTHGIRRWVHGHCVRCGLAFVQQINNDIPKYCSKSCKARDAASRRRARQAGATIGTVRRWYIHERDGWTCHICGDPVNRTAVAPDLDAPVLDHVIALAVGGLHAESNLKTAHFYCNSVKRELPLADVA